MTKIIKKQEFKEKSITSISFYVNYLVDSGRLSIFAAEKRNFITNNKNN